ncbi:DUF6879 family protein [Kitasatospora viridis]|uniref:DUF6879 domain-containing protein n=1 Tax=Kitasatospora viridis TaxID=281105 RepID=A0A561UC39_9ACTN|nr:DUF6879 family protein [Kitasatospora viridis]TWF96916.1 hypothetical protein FHX73_11690 [Kitasatospora viridis]
MQNVPDFWSLLQSAQETAVHLELRDSYGVSDEAEEFEEFKRSGAFDDDPESEGWAAWVPLVRETVARGVVMRRARIVSEPVTDYGRFLHASTGVIVGAGEQVHWLPRRHASDIALPGNDFWLIDGRLVQFHHFTGDGDWAGHDVTEEPAVAELCVAAFEAVWRRATPHDQYTV